MEFALFFALLYLVTLGVGLLLERIRVPWFFAALLLGIGLAWRNPFANATGSEAFTFLGELGLLFFLVVIGLSMDIERVWENRGFLFRVAIVIMGLELVAGGLFIHFVFGTPWVTSFIVAMVFATVGEAFLLPILHQLGVVDTDLGQTILGVALIDNTFELLSVVAVSVLIGSGGGASALGSGGTDLVSLAIAFGGLAAATVIIWVTPIQLQVRRWLRYTQLDQEVLFGGVLMLAFLFIWIGGFAHASAVGALLAGIALRRMVPEERREEMTAHVKVAVYALLGPILFVWVGVDVNVGFLIAAPLLILAKVALVKAAKVGGSLLAARRQMGTRRALFMGVSLSVKFSTSIVLIKLLFERGMIQQDLYSLLVASKIAFKFIVPFLLVWMARNWWDELSDESFEQTRGASGST